MNDTQDTLFERLQEAMHAEQEYRNSCLRYSLELARVRRHLRWCFYTLCLLVLGVIALGAKLNGWWW